MNYTIGSVLNGTKKMRRIEALPPEVCLSWEATQVPMAPTLILPGEDMVIVVRDKKYALQLAKAFIDWAASDSSPS